jgi:4-hydroxy-tetrahydrodipicolinate reductase
MQLRILVTGSSGRMGREILKTLHREKEFKLLAGIDPQPLSPEVLSELTLPLSFKTYPDLTSVLLEYQADILIDFTTPQAAFLNIKTALEHEIACVVGTTGIEAQQLKEIESLAIKNQTPVLIAPNFALGAVLMMRWAQEAAKYYKFAEIIEAHHEQKLDAPSGTALKTAQVMQEAGEFINVPAKVEKLEGARGGVAGNIHIHSLRLPGIMAQQSVMVGREGETLTITHNVIDRSAYMGGLLLAVRKIKSYQGLLLGLERLL